jgi:hypothetical protein
MNIHEGARRMCRAGQWMILIPLTVLLLLMLVLGILDLLHPGRGGSLGLIRVFLPLMIPGALLWLAGWIVEGFAKEEH